MSSDEDIVVLNNLEDGSDKYPTFNPEVVIVDIGASLPSLILYLENLITPNLSMKLTM